MKTNFHTHTTFCDGKDSVWENASLAYEKGFSALGFSAHALYPFSSDWHIAVEEYGAYRDEIARVKSIFAGKMKILAGFEVDYIPGISVPSIKRYEAFAPDFIIGSVHYVPAGNECLTVDDSPSELLRLANDFFGGSARKMTERYFELEREMLRKGDFSIIGHPDLVLKFNDTLSIIDESEKWFRNEIEKTADEIARAGVVAEINTGAISRGYRKTPYPGAEFLSLLRARNVPITINSDAHSKEALDCAFDVAAQCAKAAGYTETVVDFPTPTSFAFAPL